MPYSHESSRRDSGWLADRLAEQEAAHDGEVLRFSAEAVLPLLPEGPIELVATSAEGCALAAVVAAAREAAPTRWRRFAFGWEQPATNGYSTVVIEAIEIGDGLREALTTAFPGAPIIAGAARPVVVAA